MADKKLRAIADALGRQLAAGASTTKPKPGPRVPAPRSNLEALAELHLKASKYPYDKEVRFDAGRKWRFDFVITGYRLAIECEGGNHQGGRHVQPEGFEADCEKYLAAAVQGWTVLRVTYRQIKAGDMIRAVDCIIKGGLCRTIT